MKDAALYVSKIIYLNNNRTIVGKTRLQKTAYFLEEFRVGNDFIFEYHHYGPYSEELSIGIDDAEAMGYVKSEWKHTQVGTKYAVLRSNHEAAKDDNDEKRNGILRIMSKYDSVCLELAATADFLSKNGFEDDYWPETIKRKEEKATPDRISKAKNLLLELSKLETHHRN